MVAADHGKRFLSAAIAGDTGQTTSRLSGCGNAPEPQRDYRLPSLAVAQPGPDAQLAARLVEAVGKLSALHSPAGAARTAAGTGAGSLSRT